MSRNHQFTKQLENIRRKHTKTNGKEPSSIEDFLRSGVDLIKARQYDAARSTETFGFLTDLIDDGHVQPATEIIYALVEKFPDTVAENASFGQTLTSLSKIGEQAIAFDLLDRLITGKHDHGPSLDSSAKHLAGNESVLKALQHLSEQSSPNRAALALHRLAIYAPNQLNSNPQLTKSIEILNRSGQTARTADIVRILEPSRAFHLR